MTKKININGQAQTTEFLFLQDLHHHCFPSADLSILNGYATTENLPLQTGDDIYFIEKNKLPSRASLEAMMCSRHTPHVHEKVKQGKVAIAGLGGLGSHAAIFLARTGVGSLHLVDFDTVDVSNLNRQAYRINDLGKQKTAALAAQIAEINPFIHVHTDFVKVTSENAASLFADDCIICEAFDNPAAKAMLINTILTQCPKKYIVSASGMAGYGNSNDIQTRKITDHFYLCGDGTQGAIPGRGLMAPRVAICSAHEANLIVKLLVVILPDAAR